jgi:hypothetical protein
VNTLNRLFKILLITFSLIPCFAQDYPEVKSERPVVNIKARLATRHFIYSTLIEIFGPSSKDQVYKNIFSKPSLFKGPCDPYSQVRTSHDGVVDPMSSCFERNSNSTYKLNSSTSLLRSAMVIKTCSSLVSKDDSFNFALKKVKLSVESDINKETISSLYQLFHPFRTLSESKMAAVEKVTDQFWFDKKKWKSMLQLFCIDPSWQTL